MKALIAQILIGTSIFAAVVLGYRDLSLIYLLRQVVPEETVFFYTSGWNFLRWLFIALSPLVIFGGAIILHRDSLSSKLGRVALFTDILYLIAAVAGYAYVHRFVSALDHHT